MPSFSTAEEEEEEDDVQSTTYETAKDKEIFVAKYLGDTPSTNYETAKVKEELLARKGDATQKGIRKYSKKVSLDIDSLANSQTSAPGAGETIDDFGVSALSFGTNNSASSLSFQLGRNSYTLEEGGEFVTSKTGLTLEDKNGDDEHEHNNIVLEGKKGEGEEDIDDNHYDGNSAESIKSTGTSHSVYSEKIKKASRRGARHADSSHSLDGSEMKSRKTKRHKKKEKKKKKKKKKSDHKIRDMVGQSADNAIHKIQIENMPKSSSPNDVDEEFVMKAGDPMNLPSSSDPLSPFDFKSDGQARMPGGSRDSMQSMESNGNISNLSSTSNTTLAHAKYHDKKYLVEAARTKFQKGLHSTRKKRYALARTKFRAALKARILLHENIQHLSIAPVHEMIGLVERKLREYEKSMLHLRAALEICEGALEELMEEYDEDEDEDDDDGMSQEFLTLIGLKGGENKKGTTAAAAADYSKKNNKKQLSDDPTVNIGEVDLTERPPTISEQRQMLLTNIERIKKTIEIVKNDALKKKAKAENNSMPGMTAYRKDRYENSASSSLEEANNTTTKAKVNQEDEIQAWAETMERPEIVRKSAEELVMETLQQKELDVSQLATIEQKSATIEDEVQHDYAGGVEDVTFGNDNAFLDSSTRTLGSSTHTLDSSMGEVEPNESDSDDEDEDASDGDRFKSENNGLFQVRMWRELSSIKEGNREESFREHSNSDMEQQGATSLAVPQVNTVEVKASADVVDPQGNTKRREKLTDCTLSLDDGTNGDSFYTAKSNLTKSGNGMGEETGEVQESKDSENHSDGASRHISWASDSFAEEKEMDGSVMGTESWQQAALEKDTEEDPAVNELSMDMYQPKLKHGQGMPRQMTVERKPLDEMKHMSTYSEDILRSTYHTQSEKGEEYYNIKQYVMAIGSFNDAKFALLIIAGMPDEKSERDNPSAVNYAKLRDHINSALLSERITDCHVETFFRFGRFGQETTDDFSHVNYRQAATILAGTRKVLMQQIEELIPTSVHLLDNDDDASIDTLEEERNAEVNDLKDLVKEATLSMARIYSKQGCVYAKLDNHYRALDLFGDSLVAWEEAANLKKNRNSKPDRKVNLDLLAVNDDALILETHEMIKSYYETNNNASKLSPGAHSLLHTAHIKALSTALQMATSHHALGVEIMKEEVIDDSDLQEAIDHHLQALKFARETQRLRVAFNVSFLGSGNRSKAKATFIGAAMSDVSGGRRITTRGRNLSVLMTQSDSTEMVNNVGKFMKRCTLLMTQQQICLSRATFCLGLRSLSKKWLLKAIDSMNNLGLSCAKNEAEVAMYLQSVMMREPITYDHFQGTSAEKRRSSADFYSLYDGGLAAISQGPDEQQRMLLHYAVATLQQGFHMDAVDLFKQSTDHICLTPGTPPEYYDEVLHAVNAQIIIEVKEGNMDGAVMKMNRRLDLVSQWIGNRSLELANDLKRLACFQSVLGNNENCAKHLEESLHIGSDHSEYDTLDSMIFLATTHDTMNDADSAMSEYECALAMEENMIKKAKLMNAMAHLHMRAGGQCDIVAEYLDRSLGIQEAGAKSAEFQDTDLLMDTMILYGNAMASKNSFTEAIYWYESALNSNPYKSPIHSKNLRAWYNKGVTLFRSGDIIGAGHAFGRILDEVDKKSTTPRGTAFVLNAIGSIYFANKDYDEAIQRFEESLCMENDELSTSQRAGTLCNIATAYYKMGDNEESETNFDEALRVSGDDDSSGIKASIMGKFAFILYKRKLYLRAYNLFTEAASIEINSKSHNDEVNTQFKGYAETCRLLLVDQNCTEELPVQKEGVIPQKPRFGMSLISIPDGHNATRYSDAVYPSKNKMLLALGINLGDQETIVLPSEDTKILCGKALEYLLKQTEVCRTEYALLFEGLLAEKMNSKFIAMTASLDHELDTTDDA